MVFTAEKMRPELQLNSLSILWVLPLEAFELFFPKLLQNQGRTPPEGRRGPTSHGRHVNGLESYLQGETHEGLLIGFALWHKTVFRSVFLFMLFQRGDLFANVFIGFSQEPSDKLESTNISVVIRQVSECLLVYFLSVISTLFPTPVSFLIQKWNSESHNQVCIINRKASILKMSPKSDQNHLSNVDESGLLTQISQFLSLPCIFSVRRV